VFQPAPALGERQRSQVGTIEPQDIESHVTGAPRHAEQFVELWSAGLVGHDHLAVDYRLVNVEYGGQLVGQNLETAHDVAVARDEAATALLKVEETPEAIVFELKEPFRAVERLLPPGRDNRLYAGKCHLADMALSVDLVHKAGPHGVTRR
jgi:hypothetical protein